MDHDSDAKIGASNGGIGDKGFKEKIKHNDGNFSVVINRDWYTRSSFNVAGEYSHRKLQSKERIKRCCSKCIPDGREAWKSLLFRTFPFISTLRSYGRSDFLCDVIAGLTVGIMHIPQGMAYGILANIDPVYGLYTSFFSIFVYFIFGTSRHISIGVFAVVSLMIGSVVDKADCTFISTLGDATNYSNVDPFVTYDDLSRINDSMETTVAVERGAMTHVEDCKVRHALAVTFVVGILQLLMGVTHFGFVTVYLSDPLTRGLITGAGVHVFSSQVKHVFGISTEKFSGPFKLLFLYKNIFEEIKNTNPAPLVMSIVCIVIIYSLQRWLSPVVKKFIKMPLPVELLVLIFGTLLSHYLRFSSPKVFDMTVVGKIPMGIPLPRPPDLTLFPQVILDAVAIAIVSFTINISMAKMFSSKHEYKLDSNQELVAYGLTNAICSCFNSYVSTASLSRTLVQESTGGKTQVAGLVASVLLLIVLLFVGPLFYNLPNCVLAAVIIVNLRGIFLQALDLKHLRKISTSDTLTWIVTCVGTILTDVDLGLLIGLSFSFFTVVVRNQTPNVLCLGNIEGTEFYENIKEYKKAAEVDGMKIFSFGASLFYANAEHFQTKILGSVFVEGDENKMEVRSATEISRGCSELNESELPLECRALERLFDATKTSDGGESFIKNVVIDCGGMTFVDDVGIKALNAISSKLAKKEIKMSLAQCSNGLNRTLRVAMELKKLEKCQIFLTVHDAVGCLSGSRQ